VHRADYTELGAAGSVRIPDVAATSAHDPWRVAGTYFESCNCDAVCPCRMVNRQRGGRSTHGVCYGALSWRIEEGRAGDLDLGGLAVAMAYFYDDDVAGSPWRLVLHVDAGATPEQHEALVAIFLGDAGGEQVSGLPWVRKACESVAVRSSPIEIRHDGNTHELRVGRSATVRVSRPVDTDDEIACIVPGYDRIGTELYGDDLILQGDVVDEELHGTCAFVAPFDYGSGPRD
jgi:hypothetical protein